MYVIEVFEAKNRGGISMCTQELDKKTKDPHYYLLQSLQTDRFKKLK
jgi:hypothetical protein